MTARYRVSAGALQLDGSHAHVMGVLNVTPDSFSDGGQFLNPELAFTRARAMVDEGAAIIDVGGESTRPGAAPVGTDEELERVLPVVERIVAELPVAVSVDTSSPEVMGTAAEAGAALVNDVRALARPGALDAVAKHRIAVCLMHMQGEPSTMQRAPLYDDPVVDVQRFFETRLAAAEDAGVERQRVLLDPGFGFGKKLGHNLSLLAELQRFAALGCPLLVGLSRKSMLGTLTGRAVTNRLAASIAAASVAIVNGACIVRAHDVAATVDAAKVVAAATDPAREL